MITSNEMTDITAKWISNNNYWGEIEKLKDVIHLKKWVMDKLFKDEKPSESFIKGARFINWETILKSSHIDVK